MPPEMNLQFCCCNVQWSESILHWGQGDEKNCAGGCGLSLTHPCQSARRDVECRIKGPKKTNLSLPGPFPTPAPAKSCRAKTAPKDSSTPDGFCLQQRHTTSLASFKWGHVPMSVISKRMCARCMARLARLDQFLARFGKALAPSWNFSGMDGFLALVMFVPLLFFHFLINLFPSFFCLSYMFPSFCSSFSRFLGISWFQNGSVTNAEKIEPKKGEKNRSLWKNGKCYPRTWSCNREKRGKPEFCTWEPKKNKVEASWGCSALPQEVSYYFLFVFVLISYFLVAALLLLSYISILGPLKICYYWST